MLRAILSRHIASIPRIGILSTRNFSTTIETAPVDLHYHQYPANRTSPVQYKPLLIIHGLMGHSNNWRNVVSKTVMTENRLVVCVDLRNHGASPHSEYFSYEALSNDIIHVLDRLGIDKADVLGHSLGGKVAMATALTHGNRVHNLIVADIAPLNYAADDSEMLGVENILRTTASVDLSNQASRKDIDAQLARGIPEIGVRQFILTNLASVDPEAPNPTNAAYYWKPNVTTLLKNYDGIRAFDLPEYAEKFYNPTLFLRGGRSKFVNVDTICDIAEPYFGNIEVETIEGAGHWLHAEKPNEFITRVVEFLNRNK